MDLVERVRRRLLVVVEDVQVRFPGVLPVSFVVAGVDEEGVTSGVEAGRVAELGEVLPDREQRLLGRVLGELYVAKDPMCDGVKPVAAG